MKLPKFLTQEGDSLIFNMDDSEFVFYVPEIFFNDTTKMPIAEISGSYVTTIGILLYSIIDSKGKISGYHQFTFPTMFMCKPSRIEKVKNLKINLFDNKNADANIDSDSVDFDPEELEEGNVTGTDYRILHFKKGDEVVSQMRVPQLIDNVELFFKLTMITAKIPNSIPYDKIWELFLENMELNGNSYGAHAQFLGLLSAGIARNPKNITEPFRYTSMNDMTAYTPVSVKKLANFTSPFTNISSEGMDEGIMSAVLMHDKPENEIPYSPLEKVLME